MRLSSERRYAAMSGKLGHTISLPVHAFAGNGLSEERLFCYRAAELPAGSEAVRATGSVK